MKEENIWTKVLRFVAGKINEGTFNTWFRPTTFVSYEGGKLTVQVPNQLFKDWLTRNYATQIQEALTSLDLADVKVVFEVRPDADKLPLMPLELAALAATKATPVPGLNPGNTFGEFVVGTSNQLAHAAARAVAERLGEVYNPLFIHGGVGLGKTHLLHAIGHYVHEAKPDLRIVSVSAEAFMNELVNAIQHGRTEDFRQKFRSADILLIDDAQFLAGKERTQDELFHTFNALYEAQRQVVLASDTHPRAIEGLDERLRSRFQSGLVADIQPPDLETKIGVIKLRAAAEVVELDDAVVLLVATMVRDNVRTLVGAFTSLVATASLGHHTINLEFAQGVVGKFLGARSSEEINAEQVIKAVADFYGMKPAELKAKTNRHAVAHPRQVAAHLLKKLTPMSFPQIGRMLGYQHHTTIMHSVAVVEERMAREPDLHRSVQGLLQAFK